jgi:hypothetical protein
MAFPKVFALGSLLVIGGFGPLVAQNLAPQVTSPVDAQFADLGRGLQIAALMAQLRQEGLDGADNLAEQFEIAGTAGFQVQMDRLFDTPAMEALFLAELQKGLKGDPDAVQTALNFFASPLGQKVVSAEIVARQALTVDGADAAANAAYDALSANDQPRRDLIDGMMVSGDLIEFNVMGGLNSNFAFMRGMASTGALGDLPENEMLAQVWQDEDALRQDSGEWLTGFMALAYRNLTLAEVQEYSDFITSPAGRKLNAALFAGFDTLYGGLSLQQGRIVGGLMQGEDI